MHRQALPASLALLALLVLQPPAAAQAPAAPVPVDVEIYVLSVGNYDTAKGTYLVDFYLTFGWDARAAPANFTPLRYEFMNGRASSTERLADETDASGVRTVTLRIQANLYAQPRFENYPYDAQQLEILLEDQVHTTDRLVYRPQETSGLDADARIAGWRIKDVAIDTAVKHYPPDEDFDRVRLVITVSREPLSSTIKSFLPPVAFMLVAGLGFFFHPSKVANRIALGTGMLISAVAFHISQTQALPSLGALILFDKAMIAVYVFLVGCLTVSTLIHIDEDYWTDRDHTMAINFWGVLGTVGVTMLTFVLLVAL